MDERPRREREDEWLEEAGGRRIKTLAMDKNLEAEATCGSKTARADPRLLYNCLDAVILSGPGSNDFLGKVASVFPPLIRRSG